MPRTEKSVELSEAAVPSGVRKLPPSAALWLTPLMLSVVMTFVVSLVSTLVTSGWTSAAPRLWLRAWGLSWVVAFPTLLLVLPLVRRATGSTHQAALVTNPGTLTTGRESAGGRTRARLDTSCISRRAIANL
jgi:hypothetical protein